MSKQVYRAFYTRNEPAPGQERLVLMHTPTGGPLPTVGATMGKYSLVLESNQALEEHALETDDEQALRSYLAANVCVNPTEPNRFFRLDDFSLERVTIDM